jgi:hypothetical protein
MEFYYRKGGREGGMEVPHAGKKSRIFILSHFYISLNLEKGRKPTSLPISSDLPAMGRIWGDSCIYWANSQVP